MSRKKKHFIFIDTIMSDDSSLREDLKKMNASLGDLRSYYDIIIVGAGLSGSVFAEQASTRKGLKSLIIEKRNHIGGNCYDYVDEKGIRV